MFSPSVRPHNLATGFSPPLAAVVSAEVLSHGRGILRCLQKEMATYRHWSVSLWRDQDDVPHCRILSPDKTEWQLISATLCRWRRCFVADQLWFMTRIREKEDQACGHVMLSTWPKDGYRLSVSCTPFHLCSCSWLTSYGLWHAYEKKTTSVVRRCGVTENRSLCLELVKRIVSNYSLMRCNFQQKNPRATTERWSFHITRPAKLYSRSAVIFVPLATEFTSTLTCDQVRQSVEQHIECRQLSLCNISCQLFSSEDTRNCIVV